MNTKIKIPKLLSKYTNNSDTFECQSTTALNAISSMCTTFPKVKEFIFNENDELNRYITVFINQNKINTSTLNSELENNSTIQLVIPIAGG